MSAARKLGGQALRFALVGIAATLAHFLALSIAVELFGVPSGPANGLAFLVAVLVTYFGQSRWVFHTARRTLSEMRRFATVAATGFVLNIAIMSAVTQVAGLPYQAGFLTATVLVPVFSFLMNKLWVFR